MLVRRGFVPWPFELRMTVVVLRPVVRMRVECCLVHEVCGIRVVVVRVGMPVAVGMPMLV
jgi:hypothetical protein